MSTALTRWFNNLNPSFRKNKACGLSNHQIPPIINTQQQATVTEIHLDALIVGAGFGGIYQLHKCLELGLTVKVIDLAGDVGGTWYWNRYPGCMSDTHSFLYRYSWDKEDLRTYPWSHHYVQQPDVLKYLEHVVKKHDLRKYMQFNTEMTSADWDCDKSVWRVKVRTGEVYVVRYLVTALGLLSKQNIPNFPGIEMFKGQITHTAAWDTKITWTNKRVGVIGCGSTGTQVITAVAPDVKSLVCFQRHPQYSVPAGNKPVELEYRNKVNENYDEIFENAKNSATAFGFVEATRPCMSVSAEEREKIFQELWDQGNGFKFMFGGFGDIVTNEEANEEACKFMRKKISEIVKDPKKVEILTPHDYYARRPLCDSGYYQTFNHENVNLVDLKQTPITAITGEGIQTSDGKIHELDLIVFATGFEAIDGNYTRVIIRGRGGETIKDHWRNGPTGYLGLAVHGFPNMFMTNGPQGPFANIPPSIEVSVDFISSAIEFAEKTGKEKGTAAVIEAKQEAESEWNKICIDAVDGNLFKKMNSWVFGTNVPGSQYATKFYFGGLGKFRAYAAKAAADGYSGFELFAS